jgi:hypothetical protein
MSERKLAIYRYRMPDTGIGRKMGFESDDAFRDHMERERAALPPAVRAALDDCEKRMLRVLLYGEDAPDADR